MSAELLNLPSFPTLLTTVVIGLFSGLGSALGTWLVTRHLIARVEQAVEKRQKRQKLANKL